MARRTTRKPPPRVGQVGISFDPSEKARALKDLEQATTVKERAEAMSDLIAVQSGGTPQQAGEVQGECQGGPQGERQGEAQGGPQGERQGEAQGGSQGKRQAQAPQGCCGGL